MTCYFFVISVVNKHYLVTSLYYDNRTNDNGAVEVREGELETAVWPGDDRREVIEEIKT